MTYLIINDVEHIFKYLFAFIGVLLWTFYLAIA
jgi:hypothetical protein